jgi:hypothetical protein
MLKKLLAIALLTLSPILFSSQTTAGTCAERCPEGAIQFVPGQAITVQVKNRTQQPIKIEKVQGTKATVLEAGQTLQFKRTANTIDNLSIIWDAKGLPLRAIVMQPNSTTLRIELEAGWSGINDRAVYLRNDGRIEIL